MYKNLLLFALGFLFIGNILNAQTRATRTSITNGNANSPFTWDCTCVPIPGDNIVVNHNVTLNADFGYSSGSVTVTSAGALLGDIPTRAFAYSGGSFSNSGTFSVGNFYHGGGTFTNTGTFTITNAFAVDLTATTQNMGIFNVNDTLYVNTNATLANTGTVNATYTATAGTITSTGTFNGTELYNSGSLYNNGGAGFSLSNMYTNGNLYNYAPMDIVYDLWNSETVMNTNLIVIGRNYWNGDTLLGTANFGNDGTISVGNDLTNSETMNGSGDYCVANSTANSGIVGGNLDVCDLTGGAGFDTNIGTIAGSVTFCSAGSCTLGLNEEKLNTHTLFPNPVLNLLTLDMKTNGEYKLILLNSVGQIVLENTFNGSLKQIDLSSQVAGMYHYRIVGENKVMSGKVVKE